MNGKIKHSGCAPNLRFSSRVRTLTVFSFLNRTGELANLAGAVGPIRYFAPLRLLSRIAVAMALSFLDGSPGFQMAILWSSKKSHPSQSSLE